MNWHLVWAYFLGTLPELSITTTLLLLMLRNRKLGDQIVHDIHLKLDRILIAVLKQEIKEEIRVEAQVATNKANIEKNAENIASASGNAGKTMQVEGVSGGEPVSVTETSTKKEEKS